MKEEDARLVTQLLDGDENAFTTLVRKYERRIHAIVWSKIGNYQTAEEITQDVFFRAYKRIASLKDPHKFAGWLHIIANRLCIDWHRKQNAKKRVKTSSLETAATGEIAAVFYKHHEDQQSIEADREALQEVVSALLETLSDAECLVVTLHYFDDMSCKEIGELLGVSANTVKSRLHRARNRLRQHEDLVRDVLNGIQLSDTFLEGILQQVANIKPLPRPTSKPILPWAISAATAVFVFLMMTAGSQYLARFQKPYTLNADAEATVEIVDAPFLLDTPAKPAVWNRVGHLDTPGKDSGTGRAIVEGTAPRDTLTDKSPFPPRQQHWVQAAGPAGGTVTGVFLSGAGDIYATAPTGIYRTAPDASAWTLLNIPIMAVSGNQPTAMTENRGTLYLAAADAVYASADKGETWRSLGARPAGQTIGAVATDEALYLALETQIFRSEDVKEPWIPMNIPDSSVSAIAAAGDTLFAGMKHGLYRLNADRWEKLPIETTKTISSITCSGGDLYVATGLSLRADKGIEAFRRHLQDTEDRTAWELFYSPDRGESWTEITPDTDSLGAKLSPNVNLSLLGDTLVATGWTGFRVLSTDAGKTWSTASHVNALDIRFFMNAMVGAAASTAVSTLAVTEKTLLQAGSFGLNRSTDGGESWQPFMKGMVGTDIQEIIAFGDALYTSTETGIAASRDGGTSWKNLHTHLDAATRLAAGVTIPNDLLFSPRCAVSGDTLYGIALAFEREAGVSLFRIDPELREFVPLQNVPPLGLSVDTAAILGAFAVGPEAFYVEYKGQLWRWRQGEPEWIPVLAIASDNRDAGQRLKLAVSGDSLYVGDRDGRLLQSVDSGNTWRELTSRLPLRFTSFQDLLFLDSAIYIATDRGVLMSENGRHWRRLTDHTREELVMDQISVADGIVYGIGETGAYQLDTRYRSKQLVSGVPEDATAFAVQGAKFYIATERSGIFRAQFASEKVSESLEATSVHRGKQ